MADPIHVKGFVQAIVIPDFTLGRYIENDKCMPCDVYKGAPIFAELRHAFFDKNSDGSYVSPDYRQSVLDTRNRGEWASTFLRNGREAVVLPEKVYKDEITGLWIAKGGRVLRVELPPDGWTLEYDKPTGFPSRTGSKEEAEKVFGDDRSSFYANRNGLRAVHRFHDWSIRDSGPFDVDANYEPDGRNSNVGVRSASRSEQL